MGNGVGTAAGRFRMAGAAGNQLAFVAGRRRTGTARGVRDRCQNTSAPAPDTATAYGRMNAGTARDDLALAHRFLGGFFRS
jgi:hypothetical protein